jgi:hypothetical protein
MWGEKGPVLGYYFMFCHDRLRKIMENRIAGILILISRILNRHGYHYVPACMYVR